MKMLILTPKRKDSMDTWEYFYKEMKRNKSVKTELNIAYYLGDRFGLIKSFFKVPSLARKDYDVICAYTPTCSLMAFLACKLNGKKFVVSVDDYFPSYCKTITKKIIYWICEKTYKHAEACIGVDATVERHLANLGVKNIHIIPHGIIGKIPKNKKKNNKFVVGFHGVLGKAKGADVFIGAIKIVNKAGLPIEFAVTGDGELKHELKNLDNVVYHGFVNRDEVTKIMFNDDICVAPYSSYNYFSYPHTKHDWFKKTKDPFKIHLPTKIIETLCLGVPVIVPDFRLFKDHSSLLILFKAGDAKSLAKEIIKAYKTKTTVKKKGQRAKKLLKERTWNKLAKKRLDIINEAIR